MPIEPGLDAIAHMGRPIDSGVFVMRDAVVLAPDIADQIGAAFDGLYLAHH
jgi:hypothetical protein